MPTLDDLWIALWPAAVVSPELGVQLVPLFITMGRDTCLFTPSWPLGPWQRRMVKICRALLPVLLRLCLCVYLLSWPCLGHGGLELHPSQNLSLARHIAIISQARAPRPFLPALLLDKNRLDTTIKVDAP